MSRSTGRRVRQGAVALAAVAALFAAVSCTPEPSTPVEPPAAKAVLSPTSGPAGSFVNVAAPNDGCSVPGNPNYYSSMQAALTIRSSGIVVNQAYQYIGSSPSTYATPDPYVHLRIPPATAPGVYNVYLSCYGYLDTYMYAPATFTVTPSL
ncbi:MAG: hypothetical protein U0Q22_17555 [Acidimicrobiales bacterium]